MDFLVVKTEHKLWRHNGPISMVTGGPTTSRRKLHSVFQHQTIFETELLCFSFQEFQLSRTNIWIKACNLNLLMNDFIPGGPRTLSDLWNHEQAKIALAPFAQMITLEKYNGRRNRESSKQWHSGYIIVIHLSWECGVTLQAFPDYQNSSTGTLQHYLSEHVAWLLSLNEKELDFTSPFY